MKKKLLLAFIMVAISIIAFGAISSSAETEGIYTYTVSNGEVTITDCDTSASGGIVIPDTLGGYPVTIIGDYVFSYCSSLTSITIPDSVTSIGKDAFRDCSNLTSITIPDSVTSIGSFAFYGCSSLTNITIPDSVTSMGGYVFVDCSSLTSITIPDSVTSIGSDAFRDCSNLTSITIPDSVTSMGDYAFNGCSSLTSITIPDSVTSIGGGAFYGCSSLTSINVDISNEYFNSVSGVLFNKNNTSLICFPAGKTNNQYSILDSIISIGSDAFYGCSSLTSITIPDSVTSMGDYAFYGCSSLTSITIPDSVTSIGGGAFYGCSSLTSINVDISNEYFNSVSGVLFNKNNTSLICFPAGKTNNQYSIPDSVTSIGGGAFRGCSSLTSITIPDSVTSIGGGAFNGCSSLTSITISYSVTSIGNSAFSSCDSLKDVYYNGTEVNWNNITIGRSNSYLKNATIHFVPNTKTTLSNNDKTFTITPVNIDNGKTVILALYNGEQFVEMQSAVYAGEAIPFTTDKAYTKAKVMVWNNLTRPIPVCEVENVK